jgi:hypothetical protein
MGKARGEIVRLRKDREDPYAWVSKALLEDATLAWAAR